MTRTTTLSSLALVFALGCDPTPPCTTCGDAGSSAATDAGRSADAAASDAGMGSESADAARPFELVDADRMRADAGRVRRDAGTEVDAPTASTLPELGTVTVLTERCPRSRLVGAGQRCEYVAVDCTHAGTTPTQRAELRITDPVGVERGTVWLGSGSEGGAFYGNDTLSGAMVRSLAAQGFRVVERAWEVTRDNPGGWFAGNEGVRVSACRSATLMQYVNDQHTGVDQPFCASANSGGSVELTYAMSIWRADRFLELAVPTSGPAMRLDYACAGSRDAGWLAQCEDIQSRYPLDSNVGCELDGPRPLIDQAYGGRTVCTMATAADLPTLAADSLVSPGSTLLFPNTALRFLYGGADAMAAVTLGIGYAEAVRAAGSDVEIEVVPEGIHDLGDDPRGSIRIFELLRDHCRTR